MINYFVSIHLSLWTYSILRSNIAGTILSFKYYIMYVPILYWYNNLKR